MDRPFYAKSGIVLVNKPVGVSSNKVVNMVKYHLGAKKCGHLGTLDLEGAGVLPVTVNSATKLFDFFLKKDKTYETVFVFGVETDTLDASGTVLHEKECDISTDDVLKCLPKMIGKQLQMPPQFSAKKVDGKVAYKEARKGNVVELKPKEIEVFDFSLIEKVCKNTFKFSITCSSGTYIRCLCRDLAKLLGSYGVMQCILRTRCGVFCLKDCITLKDVENGNIPVISSDKLFDFEEIYVDAKSSERLYNFGQSLAVSYADGQYKIFDENDFLGVGAVEKGMLTLKIRLL